MAIKSVDIQTPYATAYLGLTADTKPTTNIPEGATYTELDGAKNIYIFHDGAWYLI